MTERNSLLKLLLLFVLLTFLAIFKANGQCNPMVIDPNVALNVGGGSDATLDAAAVAPNITAPGPGCVNYDFKDTNGNSLGSSVVISCDPTTGNQPGNYFLVIDDGVNFSQSMSFNVSTVDNTDPTFSLPTDATINCNQDPTDLTLTGDVTDEMDNCAVGIEATFVDDVSGLTGCNGTGTITRTWTLDDGNGNSVSMDQTITVQDVTSPTFDVPADVTIDKCDGDINDFGQTGFPANRQDNCTVNLALPTFADGAMVAGSCPNEMIVTRTWTLVDDCNNALQLDQQITLRDITDPTSTLADLAANNDPGTCGASVTVQLTAGNTSDNCDAFADLSITNDFNAGGANATAVYPVGTTTVTFTITDQCGNAGTHMVDVVVTDNEAPVITGCPADVTLNADAGECDNTFSWTAPVATDNCMSASIVESIFSDDPNVNINTGTPGPGRVDFADFPIGITEVSYAFRDVNGVADTCEFVVTVLDNQAPSILCPADQTISIGGCNAANELMPDLRSLALVTDNCPADFTIVQSPAPNTLLSSILGVTPADGETFTVTFTVTDNFANNGSDNCSFGVTIEDDSSLSLTVPGAVLPTVTSTCGPITVCAPTATDECGNLIPGTPFPGGIATIVGTCSAPCTMNPPVNATANLAIPDGTGAFLEFGIPVSGLGSVVDMVTIDLEIWHTWVGDLEASLVSPSGTEVALFDRPGFTGTGFGCGQNNLLLSFDDAAGNTAADLESACGPSTALTGPPYAINGTFQAIGSLSDFNGDMTNGTWILRIRDNVGFDSGSLRDVSLGLCTQSGATINEYEFPVGMHSITWNYDDGNGNLASQSQQINVSDDADGPVFTCQDITVELDDSGNFSVPAGAFLGENITIAPGENLSFFDGTIEFCITAPVATTVGFNWDYSSNDISAIYDPFGYSIDGTLTDLATSDLFTDFASLSQSGSETIDLAAGEEFCFVGTTDNFFGSSTTVITNFTPSLNEGTFAAGNWTETSTNAPGSAIVQSAMATDNCGVDFSTLAIDGAPSLDLDCSNVGNNTATVSLSDINGNVSTCVVNILVQDNIPPVLTNVPADVTVDCGNVPAAGTPDVNDNCSIGLNAILSEVSTRSGNPNTCSNYTYTITRTWTSTDDEGNVGTGVQVITVEDNDAPSAPAYADNIAVDGTIGANANSCDANVSLELTGLTDCAPFSRISITNNSAFAFSSGADASGIYPVGTHNVNFTVTDPCGNSASYNRVFTVVDDVSPIAICQNITLGLPSNGVLTLLPGFINNGSTDNCGSIVSFAVSPNTFDCSHADGVTPWPVTLTVVDDSGNSASCSSTIIIQDNFAPMMSCQDITIELDAAGQASITAADVDAGTTDNCTAPGDLVFSLSQSTFTEADFGTTTVTLTATDSNGNSSSCTSDVTVEIPETCFEVGTDAGPSGTTVFVPIDVTNFINVGSFQFLLIATDAAAVDLVDVTATSALGFGSFSTFQIGEDSIRVSYTVPQVPYMPLTLADGTTILEIEVFLAGNVGDFSFLSIVSDPATIPGELIHDFNGTFFQVTPLCSFIGGVAINAPPSLFISGEVFTEDADPIALADVDAYNTNTFLIEASQTTASDGQYNVGPVLGGDTYEVGPTKDINWTNGVTAFDLGKIQQHVVGFDTLGSVYKKIAADAFKDNQITTFDILQLQIMLSSTVLGPGNLVTPSTQTSWVFLPAVDTPATLTPLFVPAYSQIVNLPSLMMDTMGVDFIGVKIGDVTGNADPLTMVTNGGTQYTASEGRSLGENLLKVEDRILTVGEEVTIPFYLNSQADYLALQWALDINTEYAKVVSSTVSENVGLTNGDINLNYTEQGKVVVIGYNAQKVFVAEGQQLFELTLEVTKSAALSSILSIDDRNLPANIYTEEGDASTVGLLFEGELGTSNENFALYQNEPNPFKEVTNVGFILPEAGEATLTMTDVSGRIIKVITGEYAAGFNQIVLTRADLPVNGVLFYTLESGDYQAVKRMTLVE